MPQISRRDPRSLQLCGASLDKIVSCGIRDRVHCTKLNKLLQRTQVIHLEFKLFIVEVKKLLENEHHEKDQRINPFAPCVALPIMRVAVIK